MLRWTHWTWATLVSGGVALAGAIAFSAPIRPELVLNGSTYPLDSADPDSTIEDAVVVRSRQLLDHDVYLSDGESTYPIAATALGYAVDEASATAAIKQRLEKAQRHRDWKEEWGARLLHKRLKLSFELKVDHDAEVARPLLEGLATLVDRPPVDAQLLIAEHEIVPSRIGRRTSIEASLLRLAHRADEEQPIVELSIEEIPPQVTEEQLAPVDITQVLSSFETSFRGKAGARAVNIRTAGRYLNGAVVLPGEVLSFNNYVGRRVHGRGFVDAPVIINDELEKDVGGGVCQVATTLHGAAVMGNLEVVRRRSHSRPSGYAPLGLDATVIDGKVDMRLRNPYDEPLLVHVSFPSDYVIRVELLGRAPAVQVRHDYSVTDTTPFARRIWHRAEQPPGTYEKKQKGIQGMDVVSVLRITHPDGKVERRHYSSKYYPVPEVFWVGEGVDLTTLPDAEAPITATVLDGEPIDAPLEGATANETGEEVPSLDQPRQVL